MHINTIALTIISLCAPMLFASQNTTQDFMLRTELKSKQSSASVRQRFDNLWLTLHPTGAGFYDAILTQHESSAFGLNASLADIVHTDYYSNLAFDPVNNFYFHNEGLGNDVHYVLDMKINTDFGAAWEPVGITVASVKPKLGGFWSELDIAENFLSVLANNVSEHHWTAVDHGACTC